MSDNRNKYSNDLDLINTFNDEIIVIIDKNTKPLFPTGILFEEESGIIK